MGQDHIYRERRRSMTADTPQMLQAGEHPSDAWTMIRPGSLASARLGVAVCADSYAELEVRLESS